MQIIKDISRLRKTLNAFRRKGKSIGFVPTMGYFHEGHLALMRQAKKECDICVVSVYVNPAQFGPKEDLSAYPRDFKRDSSLAKKENVDIVFFPTDNAIYPQGYLTYIDVGAVSEGLCGRFRPGHFKGVATVVAKFLNIVQPDAMYLGQKDAQQVAVLQTMVHDLEFPVKVRVMPTRRERDGLAMSSRNVYLNAFERQEAAVLYRSLQQAKKSILSGETSPVRIIARIKKLIDETSGRVQYIECVDLKSLKPLTHIDTDTLIAVAVFFGKTRLIDNVIIRIKKKKSKS